VRILGPGIAAQAGMIGPVSTIALGVLVLAEAVSTVQLIGTAIVLLGVSLLSLRR
jgi:drug/metabolite transporter (DMT)-like permease